MTSKYYNLPNKQKLCEKYVGKSVSALPTPSVLIDRAVFATNCSRMLASAKNLQVQFRCHIKTHKTIEGSEYELGYGPSNNSSNTTSRIVVSTLSEAWAMLPLIESGKIKDILYGLPVAKLRLDELYELSKIVPSLRLMVDSIDQVNALCEFGKSNSTTWSVFVKVDVGTARAGLPYDSEALKNLFKHVLSTDISSHVSIFGVYGHSGHSYNTRDAESAEKYFFEELSKVNTAAMALLDLQPELPITISVGATPTAHFSKNIPSTDLLVSRFQGKLAGDLELHAGNYACCDLQQVATGLVEEENTSLFLLAEVLSNYEERNNVSPGESLINAGALAIGREPGPHPGFGKVVHPADFGPWIVKSVSQEHGIMAPSGNCQFIPYGTRVKILPQHACITAALHGWYFVIENDLVVDVWVPTKLW